MTPHLTCLMKQLGRTLALAMVCLAALPQAYAQNTYPNKVIKVIVPQPPGGGFDFVGRLLADRMGKQMGQSFVVENKPVRAR